MEAAAKAFEVLDAAQDVVPEVPGHSADAGLAFSEVSVTYDGRAVVGPFTAVVLPGTLAVLSAPSGAGKSSLAAAALGFAAHTGTIAAGGRTDTGGRRDAIAWAGQRPGLRAGTIAENVALGDPAPDPALVAESLRAAAAPELDPGLPVGPGGAGLSGGQAQRVAVARALYRLRSRSCGVLILDEPTSALDAETERALLASLRALADAGTAVLVVSHREAVVAAADDVLEPGVLTDVRR
jgi:ATP-binding cassette subfamily C protein CydD